MSGGGITCQKNEYYMEKDGNDDVSICCQDADIILFYEETVLLDITMDDIQKPYMYIGKTHLHHVIADIFSGTGGLILYIKKREAVGQA